MDLTHKLRTESESARCHNIDAEEIMGIFSAAKERVPNATLCYLSAKIRAQKNVLSSMSTVSTKRRGKRWCRCR